MPPTDRLPLGQAVALGLIQGPTELLPISSSAHTSLVPWLLGWRSAEIDTDSRRAFEVALHLGTAVALIVGGRWRLRAARSAAGPTIIAVALPALAGYALESPIDHRLGRPVPMAAGLSAGALMMALADAVGGHARGVQDLGAVDGLALGIAQALALAPGVSRHGATLATARARGFDSSSADTLSWQVGVPVMIGAGALKAGRAIRRRHRPQTGSDALLGAVAAFASTLAGTRLGGRSDARRGLGVSGSLMPFVAYRVALATLVFGRVRRDGSEPPVPTRCGPGEGLG